MKYCSYKIGNIIEIVDSYDKRFKYITIGDNPNDIYSHTILVYSEQTLILNYEYNEIPIDNLKIGDRVVAYHSNIMTASIPPQTSVFIIEVK